MEAGGKDGALAGGPILADHWLNWCGSQRTEQPSVQWNGLYQLYWNQKHKTVVFPLSLPGPSYQRPRPAGACVSPLVSQEADVWFPLWETRDGLEVSPIGAAPFPYSGTVYWRHVPGSVLSMGSPALSLGGALVLSPHLDSLIPEPQLSLPFCPLVTMGFFSALPFGICHLLQDSFILEPYLESPMIAAVQRSLRKSNQKTSPSATDSEMQLQERRL